VNSLERWPPRQAFEEYAAQGEHIRRWPELLFPARLLRRHVSGCAQHRARLRQVPGRSQPTRNTEIQYLDLRDIAVHQKEIARLDVPVDHAAGMRCAERVRGARHERQGFFERQPFPFEPSPEIFALEPFHGQVRLALGGMPMTQIPYDMRVLERRQDPRFVEEARCIACIGITQRLEGDRSLRLEIEGSPNRAHAT